MRLSWILVLIAVVGCRREGASAPVVVLYTSVDEPIARRIVAGFEKETGIRVVLQTDTEATKSVGLAERVRAEKTKPQADVFWSNEPFHTINLAREGLLEAYESPAAREIPEQYRSREKLWASVGLRARVIAARTEAGAPRGLEDLGKGEFKGKLAMARPTAGTTGGHVAALYVVWGNERARAYFGALRANEIRLLGGNSVVAEQVAAGNFVAGLTDNDDCAAASEEIRKVAMVFPDQQGAGTLMIPTTVGMVKGGAHRENAKKLVDYLLSSACEQKLIEAQFVLTGVRDATAGGKIKPMQVDYEEVAKVMPGAVREAMGILEGRE
ncbi:MAG TPA: extracellular solute-binding protein [Tepidisphaeraceae bacterium]